MTPLKRQFFCYALPSMLSQLLNSCFIIVDGFFIGRNLGDIGLAAINVAWPITAFIQAVSLGLGLGGAVRLSTALAGAIRRKPRWPGATPSRRWLWRAWP